MVRLPGQLTKNPWLSCCACPVLNRVSRRPSRAFAGGSAGADSVAEAVQSLRSRAACDSVTLHCSNTAWLIALLLWLVTASPVYADPLAKDAEPTDTQLLPSVETRPVTSPPERLNFSHTAPGTSVPATYVVGPPATARVMNSTW